jgi:MarR family transcriptional regulator, organic hydroperoxide resistance regulator
MADLLFNGSTWTNVDQVLRKLDEVYGRAIEALDLSIIEAYILWSLNVQDGQIPSELARVVGRAPTSFTPTLDKLVLKRLTERRANTADRRSVRIHLTPTGDKISRQVVTSFQATEATIQEYIGADRLSDFLRVVLMLQTMQSKQTGDT